MKDTILSGLVNQYEIFFDKRSTYLVFNKVLSIGSKTKLRTEKLFNRISVCNSINKKQLQQKTEDNIALRYIVFNLFVIKDLQL